MIELKIDLIRQAGYKIIFFEEDFERFFSLISFQN